MPTRRQCTRRNSWGTHHRHGGNLRQELCGHGTSGHDDDEY